MTRLDLAAGARAPRDAVVCLGFFDGVHLGHARLVAQAREVAQAEGLLLCVHTFAQMPARVLSPGAQIRELTPLPEKAALLAALGVDLLAVSPFDERMRHLRAEAFFREILMEALRARHIVCGFHHRFGERGEADTARLSALCAANGLGLSVIAPVTLPDGELVSSSAIRQLLDAGDLARARAMLGRDSI
ncbi:MAG: FAD synthetase family protein [Oscillospiraceae bacterium]|jgi:riboflavin kinase/FMN adenylyltransferase|nr:FAD synthetase family protein [Oscillospiraceae bacterium]